VDKHSYFSESPLASKYLSSGAYLLDRRTGESNQDSLVSVRMKFCSRAVKLKSFGSTPGGLRDRYLQRATKQVAKPWVPSTSLQLITDRATVSLVLFYNSRLSEHDGAREEAFRSGNRKGFRGLGRPRPFSLVPTFHSLFVPGRQLVREPNLVYATTPLRRPFLSLESRY